MVPWNVHVQEDQGSLRVGCSREKTACLLGWNRWLWLTIYFLLTQRSLAELRQGGDSVGWKKLGSARRRNQPASAQMNKPIIRITRNCAKTQFKTMELACCSSNSTSR